MTTPPYTNDEDYQAATEAFEQANFAAAMSLFLKVAERNPDEAEIKNQLGLCAFEHALQKMENDTAVPDDWRTTIGYLEEALATNGDSRVVHSLAVSHHNLGVYLNRQEAFEDAHREFERALALKPDLPEVSVSLAINYSDQGDFAKAEEILQEVIEKEPSFLDARHVLGLVFSAQGKDDKAVEEFKRAQPPERNVISVRYNLGVSYCNQGRMDLAEDAFRQALELEPEFVPALYNLGLVLREQGDFSGAEHCFEEVVRLEPEEASGHFCLASLYEKRDPSRAIPVWERFLELAAKIPSEAETVAKVVRHLAELKERAEGSEET